MERRQQQQQQYQQEQMQMQMQQEKIKLEQEHRQQEQRRRTAPERQPGDVPATAEDLAAARAAAYRDEMDRIKRRQLETARCGHSDMWHLRLPAGRSYAARSQPPLLQPAIRPATCKP